MSKKLASAPVHWTMGQPLLPDHFEAQEQALRDEIAVHLGGLEVPRHGVARVRWDAPQLEANVFRLQELTLVLPSGCVLDVPTNCPPLSFDLEETADTRVSLFLAHLGPEPGGPDGPRAGRSDAVVPRRMERVLLVDSRASAPTAELFHLVDLEKSLEGSWVLDPHVIPSSTRVAGSPFFGPVIDQLHVWTARFIQGLRTDVRDNYLAGNLMLSAQQALRGAFKLEGWLADLGRDLDPHPYTLFRMVRDFYVDVSVYRELRPRAGDIPYDHEDLGGCFRRLLEALDPLLAPSASGHVTRPSYVGFERRGELLVAELPREAAQWRQVFVLVQRQAEGKVAPLERSKMASPSRLPEVRSRSLRGIPLMPIERPPFHHDFSDDVAFFGLELSDEWDEAVRERAVALFDRPDLKGTRLFLYWR